MALLPLRLGVHRDPEGRAHPGSIGGVPPSSVVAEVLRRDGHMCQYCGFVAHKFQTVRARSEAGTGLRADDLVTACPFCEQCFALEDAGIGASAILIWLPEIGQAALHHICRAIYVARGREDAVGEAAKYAMDALMVRRYEARRRLGTDDPLVLATVFHDYLTTENYQGRAAKLDGLRLLPLDRRIERHGDREVNIFGDMLDHWKSADGPFAKAHPDQWLKMLAKVNALAGRA